MAADAQVAIFFYGGRWKCGAKADYRFVGQALTSKGIIAVIADYRLYPDVRFPAFVEDGARAIGWVRRNITRRGGDPDRIYLIGHSAGAHIAAMLSLDSRFLAAENVLAADLGGLIGLAGPYDFLPIEDSVVKEVFAMDNLRDTQPITHAGPQAPSMLLLTGTEEQTVLPRNSQRLGDLINDVGGDAHVRIYERIGHIGIILALASPFRWLAPTLEDIVAFIERTSRSKRKAA
ncbi:MAG: alpha/beta hydrolase [Geminicoccaceae bacterium]